MGVKSTIDLSRIEAEQLFVQLRLAHDKTQRAIRAEAVLMSDDELEDALTYLADDKAGGESFNNYSIVGAHT